MRTIYYAAWLLAVAVVERGVFHDDNREVLRPVTHDHRVGDLAVEVHITPKETGA